MWNETPAVGRWLAPHGVDQGVSDVDEVCLKGEEDELDAVAGLGLGDEVADVGLDGGHGKPELVADLLIGEALCDECEDLGFHGQ